jgi:hypothetical protein
VKETAMTRPTSCPIETAIAEATEHSQTHNRETHVLRGADGSYHIADADKPQVAGETLIAMVGAEGETLMYALRMVA